MNVQIKPYHALCELEVFTINGNAADWRDFGDKYDADRENAADYCCGDMRFFPRLATQAILDKYGINVDEYNSICSELESKLSWGSCGWCS